jgi:GNAT superfamily N-acetyltransferase
MSYTIRPATEADAAFLPDIEQAAGTVFRSIPDLAWLADGDVISVTRHRAFIRAGLCWVATLADGNHRLGFLSAEVQPDALHIREVSVIPPWQGRGIGKALVERVADEAVQRGFPALTLTTFRDIGWNEPFYQRLGFSTLGESDIGPRLSSILEDEGRHGLPRAQRCAMRRMLPINAPASAPHDTLGLALTPRAR